MTPTQGVCELIKNKKGDRKIDSVIAHMDELGKIHSLKEHLNGVAKLAADFAAPDFKEIAKCAGVNHDIGKCRPDFQKRVRGEKNIQCEHACCAAQEIFRISGQTPVTQMLAYCTAGHHVGLQDGGNKADSIDSATLSAALKKDVKDYLLLGKEYSVPAPDSTKLNNLLMNGAKTSTEVIERFSFFTRYIHSCLVDADFIDTERFFDEKTERGIFGNFEKALQLLNKKLNSFPSDAKVCQARKEIQKQAEENADNSDILFLNMATGSGKTLCSMKIALKAAIEKKKERIIYVIPYSSIIEQTASVFENIFGEALPVLQHHSNYSYSDSETEEPHKMLLSSENWDAPLIVTTNVQFFQSLYHHKSSRLRKLHNLANSIIVFDEVHMMPVRYLQPCLRAVGYITQYLNSQAIFMSATMPDFSDLIRQYANDCKAKDVISDKRYFSVFKNYEYKYLGVSSNDRVVSLTEKHQSNLIVVNDRKTARKLYELCKNNGNTFHLSTYMTSVDRTKTINAIKTKLSANEKVIVVSTSLIEVGVDLDFEAVYREIAGLDNVIQAAGRCNREGKRASGTVYVFERGDELRGELSLRANLCKSLFLEFGNNINCEAIAEYYRRLYLFNNDVIEANTIASASTDISSIPFRTYSESFDFLESDTINVVIPCPENNEMLNQLKFNVFKNKQKLQKYAVSLHLYELRSLIEKGVVDDCETGVYRLTDSRYYNDEIGLNPDFEPTYIF